MVILFMHIGFVASNCVFSYFGFQSVIFERTYQKHVVRTKLYIYDYYVCY